MAEEISEGMTGAPAGVGGASGAASGTWTATNGLGANSGAVGGGAPSPQTNAVENDKAEEAFPECVAAGLADMGVHHTKFQENYGKVVMDAVLPMQQELAAKVARKIGESVATAAVAVDAVSSVLLCVCGILLQVHGVLLHSEMHDVFALHKQGAEAKCVELQAKIEKLEEEKEV